MTIYGVFVNLNLSFNNDKQLTTDHPVSSLHKPFCSGELKFHCSAFLPEKKSRRPSLT